HSTVVRIYLVSLLTPPCRKKRDTRGHRRNRRAGKDIQRGSRQNTIQVDGHALQRALDGGAAATCPGLLTPGRRMGHARASLLLARAGLSPCSAIHCGAVAAR